MNRKRFIPSIVLIVVSLFVCLCALGAIYVLSVDAVTRQEKLQSMMTLGIPSAAVLIVLLWSGAGIDHLLARFKASFGVSLLVYIFVPAVFCIGLPALAAFLIYGTFNAPNGWQQMPAPPQPALEIVSANGTSVIVRTDSDSQLYCVIGCPDWDPVDEIDPLFLNSGAEASAPPSIEPPDGTVDLAGISSMNMGVEERTYFAVVEDGSVWYLQQNNNSYEAGFASGLFLTLAIIPAIAGLLVIYLGAGISALARRLAG